MSEQTADQTSGESGSLKVALGSLETPSTPFAVSTKESVPETTNVDSPKLSPEQGGPRFGLLAQHRFCVADGAHLVRVVDPVGGQVQQSAGCEGASRIVL